MQSSESFYRRIAGEGATYIGLLLVVYDTLAADLRRAAQAAESGNISARCEASNHAFLLLGHLDSWTDSLDDPILQESLRKFYAYVRTQAMLLQGNPHAEAFYELARLVGETRAAWQKRETQRALGTQAAANTILPVADELEQPLRQSWSA